jgi:hypothetical protein
VALSLRLERDNPCNTTIFDPDGTTFYTVATDFSKPDKPVTRVHDGIRKLAAEWIWRDARPDLLYNSRPPSGARQRVAQDKVHHPFPGVRVLFFPL